MSFSHSNPSKELSFQLNTPVTFIIFNRPDTTLRVFKEIEKIKPKKLLIIADGPRIEKKGEVELVKKTRSIIDRVDWDCEVLTNFSKKNMGCKNRVSSGLDWVFKQVEESIILEDDCLPNLSFFRFCQELLSRYRDDQRIGIISGVNHLSDLPNYQMRNNDSYIFSKANHIWGWATWRDRWQKTYDVDLKSWPIIKGEGWLKDLCRGKELEVKQLTEALDQVYKKKTNAWAAQWTFSCLLHGRLSIIPCTNLICNIGFGKNSTHTHDLSSWLANMPTGTVNFPLIHPLGMIESYEYDLRVKQRLAWRPSYLQNLVTRLKAPNRRKRIKAKIEKSLEKLKTCLF